MTSRRSRLKYVPLDFQAPALPFLDVGARWRSLSTREKQVARLIADGKSDKEIAQQLQIGVRTVEYHNANIFDKLGTRSRVRVAVIASSHR